MGQKLYQFTKQGFENLKKELATLISRRPQVVINLSNAREQGDLSENAGYHAAKDELSQIDGRVRELKYLLRVGKIQESQGTTEITFGTTVTLKSGGNEMVFTIVEEMEADPKLNKISTNSPIGRAIYGKKEGEMVDVETPSGIVKFEITGII